jgi:hypothetical protein
VTEEGAPREFDSVFLTTLDEEITSLFSVEVTKSLYSSLFKFHGITREKIPSQMDKLQATFQQVFGRSSVVIERHISKRLYVSLGLQFVPGANSTLADYVGKAKEKYTDMMRGGLRESELQPQCTQKSL